MARLEFAMVRMQIAGSDLHLQLLEVGSPMGTAPRYVRGRIIALEPRWLEVELLEPVGGLSEAGYMPIQTHGGRGFCDRRGNLTERGREIAVGVLKTLFEEAVSFDRAMPLLVPLYFQGKAMGSLSDFYRSVHRYAGKLTTRALARLVNRFLDEDYEPDDSFAEWRAVREEMERADKTSFERNGR